MIMKKLTSFLAFLMMTFPLVISSCSSNEGNNGTDEKTDFSSYKIIGAYHNENLDYIYDAIKKQSENLRTRSNASLDSVITEAFLAKSISEFVNTTKTLNLKQCSKEIEEISFPIISSCYHRYNPSTKANSKDFFDDRLSQYNETQKEYINMILNAPEIDVCGF